MRRIKKIKLPLVSVVLMILFVLGGSVMLLVKWPPGPGNLDWGVWLLAYCGYVYVILASLFYVRTGR